MINLPTLIALLAPAVVLFVFDQVIRRLLARRRPRVRDVQAPTPELLGPAAMPIASPASSRATDQPAAADARRVA
jgi:hypothetical protein